MDGTYVHSANKRISTPSLPPSTNRRKLTTSGSFVDGTIPTSNRSESRQLTSGVLLPLQPSRFLVLFETEPFWLIGLQPHFPTEIYLANAFNSIDEFCSYLSLFPARLSLYNKIISRFRHRFKFNHSVPTLPSDTIVLVSGSCSYFTSTLALYSNFKIIFLFDGHHAPYLCADYAISKLEEPPPSPP